MDKKIAVNGEHYFTRDTESGDITLLLLHGWPDDGTIWRYQIEYFKQKGYRVVCIDWLAHGNSSTPQKVSRCNITALAEDIIVLLDTLEVGTVHLIAHDYGATVAWEIATRYTNRFESFVPISVGHSGAVFKELCSTKLFRYYWLLLHGMPFSRWYYLRNNAKAFHNKFEQHPDAQYVLDKLQGEGDKSFFTIWEQSNPALLLIIDYILKKTRNYPKVTIPTHAIYPEADIWMTEGQMAKSKQFVNSIWEYTRIPDCGHWPQLEQADEVNQILDKWLKKFC